MGPLLPNHVSAVSFTGKHPFASPKTATQNERHPHPSGTMGKSINAHYDFQAHGSFQFISPPNLSREPALNPLSDSESSKLTGKNTQTECRGKSGFYEGLRLMGLKVAAQGMPLS